MMMRVVVLLAGLVFGVGAGERGPAVPVLLELFTSEGCSSCPPADKLLAQLEKDQPVAGVEVIVLSEHVDYWNSLGWRDPYSSAEWSERQRAYAGRFDGQVYTPELVVDGARGLIGGEAGAVTAAIRAAARVPKARLGVVVERDGDEAVVRVTGAPAGILNVALARDEVVSTVTRGENGGRVLRHVGVVYRIVSSEGRQVKLRVEAGSRVVAFITDGRGGKVLGVGRAGGQ